MGHPVWLSSFVLEMRNPTRALKRTNGAPDGLNAEARLLPGFFFHP